MWRLSSLLVANILLAACGGPSVPAENAPSTAKTARRVTPTLPTPALGRVPAQLGGPRSFAPEGQKEHSESASLIERGALSIFHAGEEVGREAFAIGASNDGYVIRTMQFRFPPDTANPEPGGDGDAPPETMRSAAELRFNGQWTPTGGEVNVLVDKTRMRLELTTVNNRLREHAYIDDVSHSQVSASNRSDLYLAAGLFALAAPLCRMSGDSDELEVFPGMRVKRTRKDGVPEQANGVTSVFVLASPTDLLLTACQEEKLAVVWLPWLHLAGGQAPYQELAMVLSTLEVVEEETGENLKL
jgi:hypothetical protein